jgi:hypothetical protein
MVVYLRASPEDPIRQLIPDIVPSFAGASGFTSAELAAGDEQENLRERERFEEYLSNQTERSLLVRRGKMWGAVFAGQWFVLPKWLGWHYLAELLHRAENGDDEISSSGLARARSSLIGMPERQKPRERLTAQPETTGTDDDFVFFMREVHNVISEGYTEAALVDGFNEVVHQCLFADSAEGVRRWTTIAQAAGNLRDVRGEALKSVAVDSAAEDSGSPPEQTGQIGQANWHKIQNDHALREVLARCDALWDAAGLNSMREIAPKVEALHKEHVNSDNSNVRDAIVQLVFECRRYILGHDAKLRRANAPRTLTSAEDKDGKDVIQRIKACVKLLAEANQLVSPSRLSRKAIIEPFNEHTRNAAAELALHLRMPARRMTEKERTECRLFLEMDSCRYVGGILRADEKNHI